MLSTCPQKTPKRLKKEDKAGAEYGLQQMGMLYKAEDMATDQHMAYKQRAALRARLPYPILIAFEKWITSYYPKNLLPQNWKKSKNLQ